MIAQTSFLKECPAFLSFLLPLLGIGAGAATAGGIAATVGAIGAGVSAISSISQSRRASRQQEAAIAQQQQATADAESASQSSFRSALRGSRTSEGTGDFRTSGGGIQTTLRSLTGR